MLRPEDACQKRFSYFFLLDSHGAKVCESCRSRQELSCPFFSIFFSNKIEEGCKAGWLSGAGAGAGAGAVGWSCGLGLEQTQL